jgi:hypothetical protein
MSHAGSSAGWHPVTHRPPQRTAPDLSISATYWGSATVVVVGNDGTVSVVVVVVDVLVDEVVAAGASGAPSSDSPTGYPAVQTPSTTTAATAARPYTAGVIAPTRRRH